VAWHIEPVGAQEGKPIPLGWALDREGHPTTDPKAGLKDSMLPAVELLVTAFTSARMGFEASSLLSMKRISPGSAKLFWSSMGGAGGQQRGLRCPH
jgi:(2R)-3-sulfolactate dehydrogenase (NADP+)